MASATSLPRPLLCALLLAALAALVRGAALAPAARPIRGRPNAASFNVLLSPAGAPGGVYCSGALVAPRWVLFAARCAPLLAGGGASATLANTTFPPFRLERVVTHPAADLALARLNSPAVPRGSVLPVRRAPVTADADGTLFGYGASARKSAHWRALRAAPVRVWRAPDCRLLLAQVGEVAAAKRIRDDQLCTNNANSGAGLCVGSAGGPLVIDGQQVAVGSYHVGGCGTKMHPDVFTAVAPYRAWIEATMGHALDPADPSVPSPTPAPQPPLPLSTPTPATAAPASPSPSVHVEPTSAPVLAPAPAPPTAPPGDAAVPPLPPLPPLPPATPTPGAPPLVLVPEAEVPASDPVLVDTDAEEAD